MAKISGTVPNFANGVSQQAMALRLASQGELQENAYSTVVEGLKKRPPTQHSAILGSSYGGPVHTHLINRDAYERYAVIMSPTDIQVYDLMNGERKTVSAPNGFSYLSYSGVHDRPPYRTMTVGDYTFVTNTTKRVALGATIEPVSPSEAMVHVMAGNYGKDYKITINGAVVAWYRTPDGTSAAQAPAVDTNYIARRLATGETVQLNTTVNDKPNGDWEWKASDTNLAKNGFSLAGGWSVFVNKGTIYIRRMDGTPFTIGVEDGYNGHAMKAIKETVQDFSDLPAYAQEGVAVKVTGSVSTEFDDYFVRFGKQSPHDQSSTPGVWREIPEPGIKTTLDAATMPHVLVRNADGTFTFKQAKWENRKAGDDNTCPPPSFEGKTISELTFFKNRLGFLSGENVILSRAGDYFDFWRATATALLDDDPIDVAAVENGVSVLRYAVGFADRLLLFADQMQFTLQGNELLTPKTASVRVSTSYQVSDTTRPVSVGNSVFFPVKRGQYSMIREYRIDPETGIADAEDITGHVPQYILGDSLRLAASSHEDILLVQARGDPSVLYVYKYYRSNEQKLQASWSRWTFPGVTRILDFGFIQSQLILVVERGDTVYLEHMEVQPGEVDDFSTFITYLDRRFTVTTESAEYDPEMDETYVPMPIDITLDNYLCVTAGASTTGISSGLEMEVLGKSPVHVVLKGDLRGTPLIFGTPFTMRYQLSTIYLRQESQGGGVAAVTEGRLQLLQLLFQFSKTAYFKVLVTPLAQPEREYVTNGRLMGDPNNRVDRINLSDGTFRVPMLVRNDRVKVEIVNDSYLPCAILGAEWIANYTVKSRRI